MEHGIHPPTGRQTSKGRGSKQWVAEKCDMSGRLSAVGLRAMRTPRASMRSPFLVQRSLRHIHACTCTLINPANAVGNSPNVRFFGKPKPKRPVTAMVGGKSVEEHEKLAASFGNGWDFRVAAVVERLPVSFSHSKGFRRLTV